MGSPDPPTHLSAWRCLLPGLLSACVVSGSVALSARAGEVRVTDAELPALPTPAISAAQLSGALFTQLSVTAAPGALIASAQAIVASAQAAPAAQAAAAAIIAAAAQPQLYLPRLERQLRSADPVSAARTRVALAALHSPEAQRLAQSAVEAHDGGIAGLNRLFEDSLIRPSEADPGRLAVAEAGSRSVRPSGLLPHGSRADSADAGVKSARTAVPLPRSDSSAVEQESVAGVESRFKTLWEEHESAGLPSFKNIVIDVRGSRGGRGDVAAGYLVATDILERAQRAGASESAFQITFIIDETSQRILSGLWHKSISPGQVDFGGKVAFHTLQSLPRSFPVADIYLALASPSGTVRFSESMRHVENEGANQSQEGIPVNQNTVVLIQTVLGNTENSRSVNPFALLRVGGRAFSMLPAGLASDESGLYSDYVAWNLRGKSRSEIAGFIKDSLPLVENGRDRKVIEALLDGSLFAGSEPGLVYGITAQDVKSQFETYLKGLAASAKISGKSYCLISPSGFSPENIADKKLRDQIEVIAPDKMPALSRAKPGKIYIVRTAGLPHSVFVGLMAYARPPPVLAGDGALSAAVILGRPFVMTKVAWNAKNIVNFREKLLEQDARPETRALLEKIYPKTDSPDLSGVLELEAHASLYEGLVYSLKGLSSSMFAAAQGIVSLLDSNSPIDTLLPSLPQDWALRLDFILQRFLGGEAGALDVFGRDYLQAAGDRRQQMLAKAMKVIDGEIEVSADGKTTVRLPPEVTGTLADVLDETKVGISGRYIEIAPGEFEMGSSPDEMGRFDDEKPHSVKLTHRIAMQVGKTTQRQFKLLLGRNPSMFKEKEHSDGDFMRVNGESMNGDHPVEQVSWYDAIEYCNALSLVKGLKPAYVIANIKRNSDGSIASADVTINGPNIYETEGYRLPTEAERERAARAETKGPYWFEAGEIDRRAWHAGNSGNRTHAIGDPDHANPWGLHDMVGNTYEWTQDWYGEYPSASGILGKKVAVNPTGPDTGQYRVIRGGSFDFDPRNLRVGFRLNDVPAGRFDDVSFRPLRSILGP